MLWVQTSPALDSSSDVKDKIVETEHGHSPLPRSWNGSTFNIMSNITANRMQTSLQKLPNS
ncbi:hypothetical protein BTUL_0197g00140 [Botrytis tulipae]|uniref:Uncharacterized protein n=1 Tax=Botrytis tulipae TaxID=87230 RepID=A0A4Z1EB87_9HELO|nr:hypothetical protein BTUL_0197g00140 [Botrytis tulipae]